MPRVILALVLIMFASPVASTQSGAQSSSSKLAPSQVVTGAEHLVKSKFAALSGKRVGLITNQTAIVSEVAGKGGHLVDLLSAASNVQLAAIFVPEHGFLGRIGAGASIDSKVDRQTGIPVYSLYGKTRKPTPAMLKNIDILVFDIQDLGVRFYTYVSTMGLAMQAAAAARIPFLVLDRPNPLGGEYVSGFVLNDREHSFVGQYRIPIVHGMTVGELAQLIAKRGLLRGLDNLELSVIPMSGWRRSMRWQDFNQLWIPTSPRIRRIDSALLYPGIALFEATLIHEGSAECPFFTCVGAEWIEASSLAAVLNSKNLPGVRFEATHFVPERSPSLVSRKRPKGKILNGVRIVIIDYKKVMPLEMGITVLQAILEQGRLKGVPKIIDQIDWLHKLAGTSKLYAQLSKGTSTSEIIASWSDEVEKFKAQRDPFLLYR